MAKKVKIKSKKPQGIGSKIFDVGRVQRRVSVNPVDFLNTVSPFPCLNTFDVTIREIDRAGIAVPQGKGADIGNISPALRKRPPGVQ